MMKLYHLSVLFCLALASCHSADTELRTTIENADSAVINYYGANDTTLSVTIVRDKKILDQLTDQITNETAPNAGICGYDGSVHFFKQDSVAADIYFDMNNDSCRYFIYKEDGKAAASILSSDAKTLLQSLKK